VGGWVAGPWGRMTQALQGSGQRGAGHKQVVLLSWVHEFAAKGRVVLTWLKGMMAQHTHDCTCCSSSSSNSSSTHAATAPSWWGRIVCGCGSGWRRGVGVYMMGGDTAAGQRERQRTFSCAAGWWCHCCEDAQCSRGLKTCYCLPCGGWGLCTWCM
jgi:hypothetical protein